MKIAIVGCAHGELEIIYDTVATLEADENMKVDLLICCGDFQSTRNLQDLQCMAIPEKFYDICTFYKYYSGEKVAPYLTIFIGGNHEASNYLQELPYGGWVAPNIYYLGYAGVVNVAGIRIGGLSGIFKPYDYKKGHFEVVPYSETTKRSVYHIRNLEVFRLKQISQPINVLLSHDWPRGIWKYGNVKRLLKKKRFLRDDIEADQLGNVPCKDILEKLKPDYWFAAHLHCKFAAVVPHSDATGNVVSMTKFLALDKCLPQRKFLQIVDIPHDAAAKIELKYDLEWLAILNLTNHLLSVNDSAQDMPWPMNAERWNFTPTQEEKDLILKKFSGDLVIPENFQPTAFAYSPDDEHVDSAGEQVACQINKQTELFCEKLGIDDPIPLVLMLSDDAGALQEEATNYSTLKSSGNDSSS